MENERAKQRPSLRNYTSMGSQHSSGSAITIPEDDLLLSCPLSDFAKKASASSDGSLTASITSLPVSSANSTSCSKVIPPSARRFSRSQTGPQLVNRGPWSRYAINENKPHHSSNSSLTSTASSTAVLISKKKNSMVNLTENKKDFNSLLKRKSSGGSDSANRLVPLEFCQSFMTSPFRRSISGSIFNDLLRPPEAYPFSTASSSQNSLCESTKRRDSLSSAWKRAKSASKQMKHAVEKIKLRRSVSTGRLDDLIAQLGLREANITAFPAMRPPFYAYKVLPYVWIGNMQAAVNEDLLSDGGGEYELRKIRRRVYVDFRPECSKLLRYKWPPSKPNILDYCLPIPKRSQITASTLFKIIVEFCKIINKARRDTKDGTQVLIYGPDGYNLCQIMVIGYLIAMHNQDPLMASDFVARSAPRIIIEEPYGVWMWNFRNYLNKKFTEPLGRLQGDMIRIKKTEAERLYDRDYIICRSEPFLTKKWRKYVLDNSEICDYNFQPSSCLLPLPCHTKHLDMTVTEDEKVVFESFGPDDEPLRVDKLKRLKSQTKCSKVNSSS
ncbi:unnamed protein product [Bursaphelenchus okinawaensis]|uniref:Uncharacterized protein n=1 Tax=Bursaphelenchus okinawaensis TaxID=465554 RepID=A0A811K4L6_9BILA|nr:unnamed protein product [Bursaphelenchus okinawaensis]CAG9090602.1 unnamed protein product [Bursaphelenchus okinawaensis]